MELLTASRLRSYRQCPRQHYHAYVQSIREIHQSPALEFGTAIHKALEVWWKNPDCENRLELALDTLPELEPFALARAAAMVVGYDTFWGDAGFAALEVEKEFRFPLLNPESGKMSRTWEMAGKIDAIVRGPDGRVWVLEHKTTSEDASVGSVYRQRLTIDGQVSQYVLGALSLDYDPVGVIYDVLVKPSQKPLKATPEALRKTRKDGEPYAGQRTEDESAEDYLSRVVDAISAAPHEYYQRVEVVRLDAESDEYLYDVWQLADQMRESARTGRAPRNPDACFRYGSPCAYWGVCTGTASLDDPTRFIKTGPNPELEQK